MSPLTRGQNFNASFEDHDVGYQLGHDGHGSGNFVGGQNCSPASSSPCPAASLSPSAPSLTVHLPAAMLSGGRQEV
ncbi:hypothetical protein K443DRAFT_678246 [Laccaria amethystina LaAM-08-1]|uniref:Unplaced genomic scaffold K443scaffold_69, whole genome shotgun sequence n=1 Tax=Laccaria amethystina LaAM-08-1 TaxID=1095629 RepID=A0A0C9X9C0_9AGAR|nr:hypothetical protein K443DRAFT_678246 [Laccaria amethystina LaAM-08-1]